ncbi:DUF3368 domain-containing protein [Candidatus Kapaibacterium sp.]
MTHQKYDVIIADTSCLILLDKISELELLSKIFKNITITKIIANEFGNILPDWITIIDNSISKNIALFELEVDIGEASAFSLAIDYLNPLLIIDDLKARNLAKKLKLNYTGTFGILLKAKELGLIDNSESLINKIKCTNFHISDELIELLK